MNSILRITDPILKDDSIDNMKILLTNQLWEPIKMLLVKILE